MLVKPLDDWINYWREESQWESPPYLTKEDEKTFKDRSVRFETIIGFDGFLKSGMLFSDYPIVHAGLIPVPYIGDLRSAEVIICLLNPGFGPVDYFAEDHEGFRNATWANLLQQDCSRDFPFFVLDPKFAWTGAFTWWRRKLGPVIEAMKLGNSRMTNEDAIAILGKKLAAVELVPYHSNRSPFTKKTIEELKSTRLAKEGVEAMRNHGTLVVYVRSVRLWGKDYGDNYEPKNGEIRYPAKSGQSASLKKVADKIADRLLTPGGS